MASKRKKPKPRNSEEEVTLKTLLEERGMTQQKLAELMDISISTVGYYVRREKMPGLDKAVRMADILDYSLVDIAEAFGLKVKVK